MKFSIVVPAFNAAKCIEKCIMSVVSQTYSDWELVVVNDGSNDNTEKILQSFSNLDNRIIAVSQENKGQFFAREKGISLCSGDYLIFLDSDDTLTPNCLSVLSSELKNKNYDILMYTAKIVANDTDTGKIVGYVDSKSTEIPIDWLREQFLSSNDFNSLWTKAFRRSLFDNDPNDYSSLIGTHCGEDKVRMLYPVSLAKSVGYISDSLYCYTASDDSVMHTIKIETADRMMCTQMFSFLFSFMEKWNMNDDKHKRDLTVYYIKNFLSVYFGVRKRCNNFEEYRRFRKIYWKEYLKKSPIYFLVHYFKYFGTKEKIKLLISSIRL